MTWWKSSLVQSISKSGEQTKKSRKITLPQVIACTLYFLKFLKQSGVSHLIFQPELPVFPRKWLVFWCRSCFNITKTNFLNMPRIDWAINIFLINSIWNHWILVIHVRFLPLSFFFLWNKVFGVISLFQSCD